jgi:hypothetical protein
MPGPSSRGFPNSCLCCWNTRPALSPSPQWLNSTNFRQLDHKNAHVAKFCGIIEDRTFVFSGGKKCQPTAAHQTPNSPMYHLCFPIFFTQGGWDLMGRIRSRFYSERNPLCIRGCATPLLEVPAGRSHAPQPWREHAIRCSAKPRQWRILVSRGACPGQQHSNSQYGSDASPSLPPDLAIRR